MGFCPSEYRITLAPMKPFEITSPAIIHCGPGTWAKIAGETARLGKRAIIVTASHLYASEKCTSDLGWAVRAGG